MIGKKLIAVYGTLKAGQYNCDMLEGGEFKGYANFRGAMYLNGTYPHLFVEGQADGDEISDHTVEIYEISYEVHHNVERMEFGAGYYAHVLKTGFGEAIIYLTLLDAHNPQNRLIDKYPTEYAI